MGMRAPCPNPAEPLAKGGQQQSACEIDPYDELPYRSRPIVWSAPERLALCALLHGWPRPRLDAYSVLELGCGDGTNLVPLAYYRPEARFVGVDASRAATATADTKRRALALPNLSFLHGSFTQAARTLEGRFDYILCHGVFSWVPDQERDALLRLCAEKLTPGGLVYLNYNARPGWNVRGMVRDFLLAESEHAGSLWERASMAKVAAAQAPAALAGSEHPYAQLMEREYRFVCESHLSYVAHEFLAPHNRAYWRSEALALFSAHGLHYVADADFNYDSGRVPEEIGARVQALGFRGFSSEDTADLFAYRQLHSPILSLAAPASQVPSDAEVLRLFVASPLVRRGGGREPPSTFVHPSGYEVEVRDPRLSAALERLAPLWPRGLALNLLELELASVRSDLLLLHRHGMLELRLREPGAVPPPEALHANEQRWGDQLTDPYHCHAVLPQNDTHPLHHESGG